MWRKLALYLTNHLTSLLPPTRLYPLKASLFRYAGVQAHATCRIVSSVRIWGHVRIGRETFLGHEVLVICGERSTITIGSFVDIGPRVTFASGTHEIDTDGVRSAGAGYSEDITVEDGVWIGMGSTILGGVTIGHKSVIGAGSVVNKSIPPLVIACGNPCRPISELAAP
ncbi:MAG: DapH/DapD/GlmU-related protein [Syntrophobacteraceae bacterium]